MNAMTDRSSRSDFNDMAAMHGDAEVARIINAAIVEPTKRNPPQRQRVTLVCAADIVPEAINWLWGGWLAAGKFHILGGAPGTGKTTLALAFAAVVTSGGHWPDGTSAQVGNVLMWSGEDDPATTLVPRLILAGADVTKVHFVDGTDGIKGKQPFDPATDIKKLTETAQALGNVRLLIVDPIVSAVKGDANSNGDTRKGLQPLVDLGAALKCAVIGITHFSKGTAGKQANERVIGSIAFSALARVVMVAAKCNDVVEGEASRILMRAKSNIGCDEGGFAYDLSQITLPAPNQAVSASVVTWGKPLIGTAQEMLADAESSDDEGGGALGEACRFLKDILSDGAISKETIFAEAKEAGLSEASIRRAKTKLGILARKDKGDFIGIWRWQFREGAQQNTKIPPPESMSTFANIEHLRPKTEPSNRLSEVF